MLFGLTEVQIIHIFFVGPFLIYMGYFKPKYDFLYYFLLFLGVYLLIKFGLEAYKEKLGEHHVWYLLHMIAFASLLLYVGVKKTNASKVAFSLLLTVGIAAFGYHLVRAIWGY